MSLEGPNQDADRKSAESFYRSMFAQNLIGISHGTIGGKFVQINKKLESLTGFTQEEILALGPDGLTHPDDTEPGKTYLNQLLAGEINHYTVEKRYLRKDGSYVWVRILVWVGQEESNPSRYYCGIIEDISREKQALAELTEAQKQLAFEKAKAEHELHQFFVLSSDAMVTVNKFGYYDRVNPAMCRILGYTAEELTSRPVSDFIYHEDLERVRSIFPSEEALKTGDFDDLHISNFEVRFKAKDGSLHDFSWNATVLPNGGIFSTGRDITKRLEQERVISYQKEQMAAASKMNALGRMAGGVAHEINNPLTIVYGQAFRLKKMAQDSKLDQNTVVSIAEQIEKMSGRIVEIINGLRMFAREGSGDPMEFVTLHSVLQDTLSFCLGKMKREGITLEILNEKPKLEICARAVQISQVLLNILNNASDALLTVSEKVIRVRYIEEKEMVGLAVEDTGPGVPPDVVGSLFQPFFTTKPVGKGTGLGLSVAKGIIDSHGGKISYHHIAGGGACFSILFPRVE